VTDQQGGIVAAAQRQRCQLQRRHPPVGRFRQRLHIAAFQFQPAQIYQKILRLVIIETQCSRIDFHKLSERAWNARKRTPLTPDEEESLRGFLDRRYHQRVSFDMKRLQKYTGEVDRFREKYKLQDGKPVWGIMAHINWDSVSDYSPMAYQSFDEWMVDTVKVVSKLPDVQWLIKVHPIEAYDNPAAGVQRLIETHFPNLPDHVHVIPAEEEISPLEFFQLLDGGVSVYGTSGLELAVQGKPIILSGEAHYGGKGFTYDGLDIESYRALLARAHKLGPLSEEATKLARA